MAPPWEPTLVGSLDSSQFDREFTSMPIFSPDQRDYKVQIMLLFFLTTPSFVVGLLVRAPVFFVSRPSRIHRGCLLVLSAVGARSVPVVKAQDNARGCVLGTVDVVLERCGFLSRASHILFAFVRLFLGPCFHASAPLSDAKHAPHGFGFPQSSVE